MNLLGKGTISAALFAATASVICAAPAQAFTLTGGERLVGNASFQVAAPSSTSLDFDFAPLGSGGTLTVNQFLSSVPFDSYTTLSILDSNFAGTPSIANFISYNDGLGGLDDFSIDWNNITVTEDSTVGNVRSIDLFGTAVFNSDNIAYGSGSAQGQLRLNLQTGSATFDYVVDPVPTPAAVLPVLGGLLGMASKRKREEENA